jgi:hypothetical protein
VDYIHFRGGNKARGQRIFMCCTAGQAGRKKSKDRDTKVRVAIRRGNRTVGVQINANMY